MKYGHNLQFLNAYILYKRETNLSIHCAKMIPVSKVVSLLLTILVALQFNGCEGGPFGKVTVEMTNKLPNLQIIIHCKDKHHDLGFQTIEVGQKWSFTFQPNPIFQVSLYFCRFSWVGRDHRFDIYDQKRDERFGLFQPWEILESGPCRKLDERQCFSWNEVISGGRQLGDENNTLGV